MATPLLEDLASLPRLPAELSGVQAAWAPPECIQPLLLLRQPCTPNAACRRWYPHAVSLYGIHKTLYLLQNDLDFRERVRTQPEAALADMPLTDRERRALLTNDVAELYRMGAHTFLMSRLPRFNAFGGLTREQYQERLRVVLDEPERQIP